MDLSMTTVAENDQGQSLLEFMFMLPLLMGLTVIMIRVNSAIQIAIVDQQYARAQALFLTFNSPIYPELGVRVKYLDSGLNQMVLGVAGNLPELDKNGKFPPEATTQRIIRKGGRTVADDPQTDSMSQRSTVRIRNTVTLCSQTNVLGAGRSPILPLSANGVPLGPYVLNQATQSADYNYCSGGATLYE